MPSKVRPFAVIATVWVLPLPTPAFIPLTSSTTLLLPEFTAALMAMLPTALVAPLCRAISPAVVVMPVVLIWVATSVPLVTVPTA